MQRGDLLAQLQDMLSPVPGGVEPGEVVREGRIIPATRQPGTVVHDAQRPQGFDQLQLPWVEIKEFIVAVKDFRKLCRLPVAIA